MDRQVDRKMERIKIDTQPDSSIQQLDKQLDDYINGKIDRSRIFKIEIDADRYSVWFFDLAGR